MSEYGYQASLMRLSRLAKQHEDAAKAKEAAGDLAGAAAALRGAAEAMGEMARLGVRQDERMARFGKARQFEEKAERLASGKKVFAGNARGEKPVPAEDEYSASVDELVCVAQNVSWDDIGGMEETKGALKYLFGLMLAKQPGGVNLPASSRVLLFGPPGTGKTLLAAACSSMLDATFFNVKGSNLLSKWFGESTKLISALFSRARQETGVSLVFIDEIDALCAESDGASGSGPERRIVSTFLSELDGMAEKGEPTNVVVIGATNKPWDMDARILQRFEKHVIVDLPDAAAREAIFRIHIGKAGVALEEDIGFAWLAGKTEGYSGRNIEHVCKDAVEAMVQELNQAVPGHVDKRTIRDYSVRVRPLNREDFGKALAKARPVSNQAKLKQYRNWADKLDKDEM